MRRLEELQSLYERYPSDKELKREFYLLLKEEFGQDDYEPQSNPYLRSKKDINQ